MTEPAPPPIHDDTPEGYQFLPRLLGSFLLAIVAMMAVRKSLYIEIVAVAGWCILFAHLIIRFGRKGLWALPGAPLTFYWVLGGFFAITPKGEVLI